MLTRSSAGEGPLRCLLAALAVSDQVFDDHPGDSFDIF